MNESPYEIVHDERGLHVRCKYGVHVLTDEEAQRVREYVNALEGENAALRELVRSMWLYDYAGKFSTAREDVEHVAMVYQRMRALGVEVDAQ